MFLDYKPLNVPAPNIPDRKPPEPMARPTSVRLTRRTRERLLLLSRRKGYALSELIQLLVDWGLEEYEKAYPQVFADPQPHETQDEDD